MRALLLAAGIGSRLRPLTDNIPKCLVPIHGRPLIGYWLQLLFTAGIERVLINTHYLAEITREYVANSSWADRIDLVHENELLGTGGTIVANINYFGADPFFLAHADNLTNFNMAKLLRAHAERPAQCVMTMLSFRTDSPQSCGILEVDGQGIVRGFHEKVRNPPGNLANAAVYVLEPEIMSYAASLGKRVLDFQTEVIPTYLGRILTLETDGYFRDIGTPERLRQARLEFPSPI